MVEWVGVSIIATNEFVWNFNEPIVSIQDVVDIKWIPLWI